MKLTHKDGRSIVVCGPHRAEHVKAFDRDWTDAIVTCPGTFVDVYKAVAQHCGCECHDWSDVDFD